jgi:DNA-3-methyladenine glycosylase
MIGARLVRVGPTRADRRVARIVEVEAYIGEDDLASHARFGRTARNAVMYGPAGRAYVYLVYGMYDCLNIVTEPEGRPAAVLVRAVEPVEGIDAMRTARLATWQTRRRSQTPDAAGAEAARLERLPSARIASGPGLVAAALDIDRSLTGLDLLDPDAPLHLEAARDDEPPLTVAATPRLGIDYAGPPWTEVPWRFVAAGHPAVSGPPASRIP